MEEKKPFKISNQAVEIAFDRVKANKGTGWLREIAKRDTKLFAHWKFGVIPIAM